MKGRAVLVAIIVACEVGFWVLLGAGLLARYLLRWRRTSNLLLISVPLVDLVLLVATVIDLGRGATATTAHGLAAVYLGFSVAFGHRTIAWADAKVAHRFAGGPAPAKRPAYGAARVRHEWREWGRAVLAGGVAAALLAIAVWWVGDALRTEALVDWLTRIPLVIGVWLVVGPLWTTLFGRVAPATEPAGAPR